MSSSITASSSEEVSSSSILPVAASRKCTYSETPNTTPTTGILNCPENETYKTITIGDAVWMAENLNFGTMIPLNQDQENDTLFEKYCPKNTEASCKSDGALYQFAETYGYPAVCNSTGCGSDQKFVQGVCPDGWHVSTVEDWDNMVEEIGSPQVIGAKMKMNNTPYPKWNSLQDNTLNDGNSSGFSAYPSGYSINGNMTRVGQYSGFHSYSSGNAINDSDLGWVSVGWYISEISSDLWDTPFKLGEGHSIRCVMNP